jgi:hypothetical protein
VEFDGNAGSDFSPFAQEEKKLYQKCNSVLLHKA